MIVFDAHTRKITDIKELRYPKCIVSASLDGKIKIWDLVNNCFVTEVKEAATSSRGVRGLTYSHDYGGNLLSWGFENFI